MEKLEFLVSTSDLRQRSRDRDRDRRDIVASTYTMVQKIVEIFTNTFMNNMEPSLGDSQPPTSDSSDDGSQLGQNPQEEEWEDWEEQEDEIDRVICLCSNDECGSVEEALALDVEKNGFDLEQFRNKVGVHA